MIHVKVGKETVLDNVNIKPPDLRLYFSEKVKKNYMHNFWESVYVIVRLSIQMADIISLVHVCFRVRSYHNNGDTDKLIIIKPIGDQNINLDIKR